MTVATVTKIPKHTLLDKAAKFLFTPYNSLWTKLLTHSKSYGILTICSPSLSTRTKGGMRFAEDPESEKKDVNGNICIEIFLK